MKTLAEITSWLKTSDHIKTVLVEIENVAIGGGQSATFYLSNKPFVTAVTDTPSSTNYDPCLVGGISFSETLSLDSSISVGYGDLEIDNTGGVKDAWVDYIWVNKPVKIYIGDPRWTRSDFRLVFSGLISDISSRSRESLNLILVDKLQRLNNPISEAVLSSTALGSDTLIPVVFGECFNVSPLVVDSATLTYQVHTGPIEDIIEVRDNGAPVDFTKNLVNGKFTLNQAPFGQITASVQGAKRGTNYYNTIPNIIIDIVKNYGPVNNRLVDSDIDLANFNTFNTVYPHQVGVYCTNRENILDVCNQLASSIGAQLTFSSLGLLKLVKIYYYTGTSHDILPEDVDLDSLQIQEKSVVRAATKIGYCKNWTVQESGLAAGINPSSLALFNTEYLYSTDIVGTNVDDYKLTVEPVAEDTLLITQAGAEWAAEDQNGLFGVPRTVYIVTAAAHLLPVELGDGATLVNPRFGLSSGKAGAIISINRDWIMGKVEIGVLT